MGRKRRSDLALLAKSGLHLSVRERKAFSREYDRGIRSSVVTFRHLGEREWTGPVVWGMKGNTTPPNFFYWNYWGACNSIEVPWLKEPRDAWTFGGSCWDGMMGLKQFDRVYPEKPRWYKQAVKKFIGYLGWGRGMLNPLDLDSYRDKVSVKALVNPGPTFINAGIKRKGEAIPIAMTWLRDILAGKRRVADCPPILWGLAGRGKPQSIQKVLDKDTKGAPSGRAIWMADTHEAVFGWRFQQPLTEYISEAEDRIDIGFNKFSDKSVKSLWHSLECGNSFFSGDWEAFDSTIPPWLISVGYRVLRWVYGVEQGSIDDQILGFLEYHNIHSSIVCPDRVVRTTTGGVSSGTVFTALIDSLANLFVLWNIGRSWNRRPENRGRQVCYLRALGDDNLVTLDVKDGGFNYRYKSAKDFGEYLAKKGKEIFGMVCHPDKCRVSVNPFVQYIVPRIYEHVPDHSRYFLKCNPPLVTAARGEIREAIGMEAFKYLTDWAAVEQSVEKGSKRWSYSFSGAVSYLSCYFLKDGTPLRPADEVLRRLGSTSARVADVYQWRSLILVYIVEHWGNLSARMNLISMYLDSFYMEADGIREENQVLDQLVKWDQGKGLTRARRYVRKYKYDRTEDPGFTDRCWWVAKNDWWPTLSDSRFSWLRSRIRAMYEVVHRVWDRGKGEGVALGKYRELFLLKKDLKGYQMNRDEKSWVPSLLGAWYLAVGLEGRTYEPATSVEWDETMQVKITADALWEGREGGADLSVMRSWYQECVQPRAYHTLLRATSGGKLERVTLTRNI